MSLYLGESSGIYPRLKWWKWKSIVTILFLLPFSAHYGFPEGEDGYDLKKLKSLLDYFVMKLEMTIVLQEQ